MSGRLLDQSQHLLARRIIDDRADLDVWLEAGPYRHLAHGAGEHAGEFLCHRRLDIEAVGGDARLAGVAHLGDERAFQRRVEVGVRQHDERRIAAKLHRAADHVLGCLRQQEAANLGGSGEGELAHSRILEHRLDDLGRSLRRDDVDDPLGDARLLQQVGHGQRRERGFGGGLQNHGAAGRHCRPNLPGGHRRRKIPRGDQHRDADRLVLNQDPVGAARRDGERTDIANRFFREPAEELGRVSNLTAGLGKRLSILPHHQLGELVAITHHQIERLAENLGALARRPRGPGTERFLGGLDGQERILHGSAGHGGDHFSGGRVGDVDPLPIRGRSPASIDIEIGMADGDQFGNRSHEVDFLTVSPVGTFIPGQTFDLPGHEV